MKKEDVEVDRITYTHKTHYVKKGRKKKQHTTKRAHQIERERGRGIKKRDVELPSLASTTSFSVLVLDDGSLVCVQTSPSRHRTCAL